MLKYFKYLLIMSFLTVFIAFCSAQSSSDFAFAKGITKSGSKQSIGKTYHDQLTNNKNEIDILFSSMFFFYKTILSSQDQNVCSFYPSCSEYGIQSIKKKGFIVGGIMTFDRLSRCNGLSPGNYTIDFEKRKLFDPVK